MIYRLKKVISKFFKAICIIILLLDGIVSSLSYKILRNTFLKPQYVVIGNCKKRGLCCKSIAIHFSNEFWRLPILRKIATRWYEFAYNFNYIGEDPKHKVLLFSCNYLKDTKCSIYWRRPFICRDYPMTRYFGKPEFLPGCGFQSKKRTE